MYLFHFYFTVTGLSNTIKLLLCSANSVSETLPRFFINKATASSSDCDIKINFPLSSITPKFEKKKLHDAYKFKFKKLLKL